MDKDLRLKIKRTEQLGMNPSTASHKLVKDILYSLILKTTDNKCHRCGEEMCREDYSIEHIVPWLHEENARELYFDLNNITFSHFKCNIKACRKPTKIHPTRKECKRITSRASFNRKSKEEKQEIRRNQYLRTGK